MNPEITKECHDHEWLELHEAQGKSAEAAVLANDILGIIDRTPHLTEDQRWLVPTFIRDTDVCAVAAVKYGNEWRTQDHTGVGDMLVLATQVQLTRYPYGETPEIAQKKRVVWENGSNQEDSSLLALRDTFQYLAVINIILPQSELAKLQGGVLKLIESLSDQYPKDIGGIFSVIEEGANTYDGYARYKEYGYFDNAVKNDPGQLLTVASRAVGGCIEHHDWIHAAVALFDMIQTARKHPDPDERKFAFQQFGKNAFRPLRRWRERRLVRWSNDLVMDPELLPLVQQLPSVLSNVGLADGKTVSLNG